MGRILWAGLLACIALGFVVAPVSAGEQGAIEKLQQEVKELKATMLEQDINTYLTETEGWKSVQGGGGGLQGVTIRARFTANFIATVGQGKGAKDIGVVDGDVDLDFDFQVTDNLVLFVYTTANNGGAGRLPANFAATGIAPPGRATLSGQLDGIGVDGTVPTKVGSIITTEAGIRGTTPISNGEFHWEMGELDPRYRYMQVAFAQDENTQFMNNIFDDAASVPWLTNAGSTVSLGVNAWVDLGANKNHTISAGWFNTPGQWFRNGQVYVQYSWNGEVSGRTMNVRIMGFYSKHALSGGASDASTGGAATWDWMATDKIGVFFTFSGNDKNLTVPTAFDFTLGAVWHGMGSRADDRLGVAFAWIEPNDKMITYATADTEFVFEVYYMYAAQDGKLQITPYAQFINKPGGGNNVIGGFADDTLFILGLRIHVPF